MKLTDNQLSWIAWNSPGMEKDVDSILASFGDNEKSGANRNRQFINLCIYIYIYKTTLKCDKTFYFGLKCSKYISVEALHMCCTVST